MTLEGKSWEDIQLDIEAKLYSLSLPKLEHLAQFLKVDVGDQVKKGRLYVAKSLQRALEKLLDKQGDKESFLNDVLIYTDETEQTEPEQTPSVSQDYEKALQDYQALTSKVEELLKQKEQFTSSESNTNQLAKLDQMLKRDFKISGSIGGEKDRLSYVGLMRQIDGGLAKGYSEADIVEAVIRCINSGTKLKSYLEIMQGITLQKLRQILRVHYKEKSATELYQELTTIVQDPKESAQDFLLRALSLRERTLFASEAEESGIRYDKNLIKCLFVHSFETGLREEVIRSKLRGILHDDESTDEIIMASLNKIVSVEEERQTKLRASTNKTTKEVKVCTVNTNGGGDNSDSKPKKDKESTLLTTLAALQAQVTELNAKFEASHRESSSNNYNHTRQNRRKCKQCFEGNTPHCNHCFKCGSTDHMARGCLNSSSGNGKMLPPRDRK